ncbi:MAG: GNAT family N-acetyltransferase [Actinomycetota bacterium]|nr:GNAT family N-acetyltransferase [Actinomycetota bacterium]
MREPLETPRLLLEPWDERRIEDFISLTGDDRVMHYIGRGGVWTRAEAIERFHAAVDHWRSEAFGWRSVVEKETRQWIGLIALNRLGPGISGVEEDEIEVGWWLVPTAWQRGIATEGAQAACAEAFVRLGATRVIARCRPANRRSLAVMRRLGMTPWREAVGRYGEELSIHTLDRSVWRRSASTGRWA